MTREQAFEQLKAITRARQVCRASGATVGTVHRRSVVDEHLAAVAAKLRDLCRPSVVKNL